MTLTCSIAEMRGGSSSATWRDMGIICLERFPPRRANEDATIARCRRHRIHADVRQVVFLRGQLFLFISCVFGTMQLLAQAPIAARTTFPSNKRVDFTRSEIRRADRHHQCHLIDEIGWQVHHGKLLLLLFGQRRSRRFLFFVDNPRRGTTVGPACLRTFGAAALGTDDGGTGGLAALASDDDCEDDGTGGVASLA